MYFVKTTPSILNGEQKKIKRITQIKNISAENHFFKKKKSGPAEKGNSLKKKGAEMLQI